jgi:hypothetical protein
LIITLQAKEAEAFAAQAAGDANGALTKLKEAVAMRTPLTIYLSPPIP